RTISQAICGASQSTWLAPSAAVALFARSGVTARCFGLDMRVATRGMNRSADPGQAGPLKNAILIAGPTASGKSDLAMELARRTGGIVVNADSMQVYSVLSVLTARPTATDVAKVPHKLYGYVHPSEPYSTGRWM